MAWEQLLPIYAEAADEARTEPPSACPQCGEPLVSGPGAVLACRFDGWQHPRDWVQP